MIEDVEAENKLTSLCTSPEDIGQSGNLDGLVSMMADLPITPTEESMIRNNSTTKSSALLVNPLLGADEEQPLTSLNESTRTETASVNGLKSSEITADGKRGSA